MPTVRGPGNVEFRGIKDEFLVPLVNKYKRILKSEPINWEDSVLAQIRRALPTTYANYSLTEIRVCCDLLCRNCKTIKTMKGGHGQTAWQPRPPEYYIRIEEPGFKEFATRVILNDGKKCRVCGLHYDQLKKLGLLPLGVHLSNYECLGHETLRDAISACSPCLRRLEISHDLAQRRLDGATQSQLRKRKRPSLLEHDQKTGHLVPKSPHHKNGRRKK
jgi:hypothetical protein